jgi:hypothetical protein
MKNKFKSTVLFILLLILQHFACSQTLQLGTLSTLAAYTGKGAITGTGSTGSVQGDVGTNDGIISGFDTSYTGTKHNNSSFTLQVREDLLKIFIHLSDVFVTYPGTYSSALGGGDTLTPGVYRSSTIGSVTGSLILDGGGDTNAVFILKFEGAFTVVDYSTIILSGGTRACNVYWIADGAILVGTGSTIKGTLFAHQGAIDVGASCDIEGRLLSTEGAITFGGGTNAIASSGTSSIAIKCLANCVPNSAVDVLETISNFVLFTSYGAVTNSATSGVIGDIGTNYGAISGFLTSPIYGSVDSNNSVTSQAKIDLDSAYLKLIDLAVTDSTHGAAYGLGDTITPGVYYNSAAGAGSVTGTLTLDGQSSTSSIFVFRFSGALSVAEKTKVILINGAQHCNIFWISEGATSMASFVFMKGSVIAHGGSCTIGANSNVEGRMLSTNGAIGFTTSVIYIETLCFTSPPPLPIMLLSFTAEIDENHVQLDWSTASELNNDYFNVEHSIDGISFTSVRKILGAGNSSNTLHYTTNHYTPFKGKLYYRLKQTDYDGKISYSAKVSVEFKDNSIVDIYPNPFSSEATFYTSIALHKARLMIYNSQQLVKQIDSISDQTFTFNRENLSSGLYWIKLVQENKVIAIRKLVITD